MKSPSYNTTVSSSLLSPHRKQLGCGIVGIVPTLDFFMELAYRNQYCLHIGLLHWVFVFVLSGTGPKTFGMLIAVPMSCLSAFC